jgi:ubiquinone/menaquinone biosynthesis C-methylase UbiE
MSYRIDDRRTWNNIFGSIPEEWFAAPPSDAMVRCSASYQQRAVKRLLDVGAGIGRWSVHLARHGLPSVVAMDSAVGGARITASWATRESLAITVVAADAVAIPFADSSFDAVVAALVLEHLDARDRRTAVAEIERVTTSGAFGFFVFNPILTQAEELAVADAGNPTAGCHMTPCGDEEIHTLLGGWNVIERATSNERLRIVAAARR